MAKTRIHRLQSKTGAIRFVRATSKAVAKRHVCDCEWDCRIATQDDMEEALNHSLKIEEAGVSETPDAPETESADD